MLGRRPKALVTTTVHWVSTTRFCLALAQAGFDVAVVAPDDHGVRKLKLPAIAAHYVCNPDIGTTSAIAKAIDAWSPDILIPGDDFAVSCLHELRHRAASGIGRNPRYMLDLIATSLGDDRSFALARKKSAFIDFARAEGLTVPDTTIVHDAAELRRRLAKRRFPQVLKLDGSWGGLGVRIVRSMADAEQSFRELVAMSSWRAVIKRAGASASVGPIVQRWRGDLPAIALQHFIAGRPANRAVACWNGEVLAGISVEALQTVNETGPATVVGLLENPEMDETVARLVRRLRLSGFVGFDFILDAANGRSVLIEMNSRPTPICHVFFDHATDLIGALRAKVGRSTPRRVDGVARHEVIALFPQELWRDPNSRYLRSSYHDVPWEEPQFIAAYALPVRPFPRRWTDALADHMQVVRTRFRQKGGTGAYGKDVLIEFQQPKPADPSSVASPLGRHDAYSVF